MKKLSLIAITVFGLTLFGCPPQTGKQTPTPSATATTAETVPAGVEHLENPAWKDMETPKDMPEFNDMPGEKAVTAGKSAVQAEVDAACKAGAHVASVAADKSRIGYVSYKNKELPVAGKFEDVGGFFVEKDQRVMAWVNVLSINSGDEVRDRKLKKIFFQAETGANAVIGFDGTSDKPLPMAEGSAEIVTVTGTMRMHGKEHEVTLPLSVTKTASGWTAKLQGEVLLPFEPFDLIETTKALLASCNHKALGTSVKLDLTLELVPGCG